MAADVSFDSLLRELEHVLPDSLKGAPDMTDHYNTPLSQDEEQKFLEWAKGREQDLKDYDLRGFWKSGLHAAANGHLTDQFKKPNHPTFSDGSIYNGVDGYQGGKWEQDGQGRWTFTPSPTTLQMWHPDQLGRYFDQREPDSALNLPMSALPAQSF